MRYLRDARDTTRERSFQMSGAHERFLLGWESRVEWLIWAYGFGRARIRTVSGPLAGSGS